MCGGVFRAEPAAVPYLLMYYYNVDVDIALLYSGLRFYEDLCLQWAGLLM